MSRENWRKRYESDAEYQSGADPVADPDTMYVLRLDGDPAVCARCGFYIADERVEGPVPAAAFDYTSEGLLCERCMNERDGGTAPHGPA